MYIPQKRQKARKRTARMPLRSQRHRTFVKARACAVEGCQSRKVIDPHHVKTRGAGGGDQYIVPLCRDHHDELGNIGRWSFERRHRVDLFALAVWFAQHSPDSEVEAAAAFMVRPEEKPDNLRRVG